jgi:hypothetical protein
MSRAEGVRSGDSSSFDIISSSSKQKSFGGVPLQQQLHHHHQRKHKNHQQESNMPSLAFPFGRIYKKFRQVPSWQLSLVAEAGGKFLNAFRMEVKQQSREWQHQQQSSSAGADAGVGADTGRSVLLSVPLSVSLSVLQELERCPFEDVAAATLAMRHFTFSSSSSPSLPSSLPSQSSLPSLPSSLPAAAATATPMRIADLRFFPFITDPCIAAIAKHCAHHLQVALVSTHTHTHAHTCTHTHTHI